MAQNDQIQLKNFNRRTVLNNIRKKGTVTKAGLASMTGLTFMAIKKILEELSGLGLVRCGGPEGAGVGRRAVSWAVNENFRYTVGIHINKFVTSVALLNLRGEIQKLVRCSMRREFSNQSGFVDMLVEAIQEVTELPGMDRDLVLGVGVGAPGPLDCEKGAILTPPNIPLLQYLPLKEILEGRTGLPVFVNKDTNVIAFGEYWYGNREDDTTLFYVDVDMGIGSGLIMDGRMNVGANSIAGEFGHITIDPDGPRCNCGKLGCLEAMSSGIAVLRELKEQLEGQTGHPLYEKRGELVIEDIFDMAAKKDLLTISILNKSAFYLGLAVSNVINILDPQLILLGGLMIQNYPDYFSIVSDVANSRKVKGAKENRILVSGLGENAGVIGAAEIVADNFFNEKVNEVFGKA